MRDHSRDQLARVGELLEGRALPVKEYEGALGDSGHVPSPLLGGSEYIHI